MLCSLNETRALNVFQLSILFNVIVLNIRYYLICSDFHYRKFIEMSYTMYTSV